MWFVLLWGGTLVFAVLFAALAVAAAAFRQEHGRYPRAAEELVPAYFEEFPVDPGTGKPLRVTARPDGVEIEGPPDGNVFRLGAAYEDARRAWEAGQCAIDYRAPSWIEREGGEDEE
jgi:hypothetical protein